MEAGSEGEVDGLVLRSQPNGELSTTQALWVLVQFRLAFTTLVAVKVGPVGTAATYLNRR